MKPAHLLAALTLCVVAATTHAQIILDFAARKTSGLPTHPRPGDEHTLRITGINLNLYSVSINARDTMLPAAIEFPAFSAFGSDAIGGLLDGIHAGITVPQTSGLKTYAIDAPWGKIDFGIPTQSCTTGGPVASPDETIARRIREEQSALRENFLPRLARTGEEVEEDYYLFEVMRLRARCERAADTAQFDGSGYITPRQVMCHFQAARHDLAALRSDVIQRADSFHIFSAAHISAAGDGSALYTADTLLKRAYARLLTAIDTALSTVTTAKAAEACNALTTLQRNESRTYESTPFRYTAGQKKLTVFITPIKSEAGLQSYTTEIAFPAQPRFYFGVGTGLYASGLYDEAYSTQPRQGEDDTAVSYWLVDEQPQHRETGITTLLKAGAKLGGKMDWLGGHIAFGPGISVGSTVRPRLMGGAGISAGRTHMLTLDGGIVAGRVERMSRALTTTEGYREAPAQATVSTGAKSWFVSVGYLFHL